jgi:hypothetical protein
MLFPRLSASENLFFAIARYYLMFSWLNILTMLIGSGFLLLGLHYFRVTRKTPEGEMISLFQDSVKVSRGVGYSIAIYFWLIGGCILVAALILQFAYNPAISP